MVELLVLVAVQADRLNVAAREALGIASMGCVAGGALAVHHRLVLRGGLRGFLAHALVALEAEDPGVVREE